MMHALRRDRGQLAGPAKTVGRPAGEPGHKVDPPGVQLLREFEIIGIAADGALDRGLGGRPIDPVLGGADGELQPAHGADRPVVDGRVEHREGEPRRRGRSGQPAAWRRR
jgi:hypothetical protein